MSFNLLGVWPLKERIIYKRLMLYQQIIHSNDDRLCKKVVEEQKRMAYEDCWYSELEREAKKLMIDLADVNTLKKSQWKKTIKDKYKSLLKKNQRRKYKA